MGVDIVARGLAASLLGSDGKLSSDKMPVLSEVPEGTTFHSVGALTDSSLIAGKTAEEILMMILYGVTNPVLTNPSVSILLSSEDTLPAGINATITGTINFDRGAIAPPYGTSGYRAGTVTQYQINDKIIETADFSIELTPVVGDNIIVCKVAYASGEQPLNSIGQNYDSALQGGTISAEALIKGVNPIYTDGGDTLLSFTYFEDDSGNTGYQCTFASESSTKKQSFTISSAVVVKGVQQFEPMSQSWQWIGGSAEESLTYFDKTVENGLATYTNNDYLTGERELRIVIEEE